MNIIKLTEFFTRKQVEEDTEFMYLFTDNLNRSSGNHRIPDGWYDKKYGRNIIKYHPTMTQAIIRGLDNAYPISTMENEKRKQFSDFYFAYFQRSIDNEIEEIKNNLHRFKGIKYIGQFGNGKYSKMKEKAPLCWKYLNKRLLEINIDNYAS